MNRTRVLLVTLLLMALLLACFRWLKPPSSPIVMPLPTPTPTLMELPISTPPASPSPTPVPVNRVSFLNDVFTLDLPEGWHISQIATSSSTASWQLSYKVASASGTFSFKLAPSSAPNLTCPPSTETCQRITINGAPYRLEMKMIQPTLLTLTYQSFTNGISLNIKGTFSGTEETLPPLIDAWDALTQTFVFK